MVSRIYGGSFPFVAGEGDFYGMRRKFHGQVIQSRPPENRRGGTRDFSRTPAEGKMEAGSARKKTPESGGTMN
jgi:hypothetical protein